LISLKKISFAYDRMSPNVLNECSADVVTPSKILILGRNGSGKSTLLDVITGFKKPASGGVEINGVELYSNETSVKELRTIVSYMPASLRLPPYHTVSYLLDLWGGSYFSKEMLESLNLTKFLDYKYAHLSDGYRHRLNLVISVSRGGMVFLDEPLRSQDDELKSFFPEFVSKYSKNRTLLVTSPNIIDGVEWNAVYKLEHGKLKNGDIG